MTPKKSLHNLFCIRKAAHSITTFIAFSLFASGYFHEYRITESATSGATEVGDPIIFTWSIVADGTEVDSPAYAPDNVLLESNLIHTLDETNGIPLADRTTDLTNRPWFQALSDAFQYYTNKTGITFQYVSYDNDSPVGVQEDGHPGGAFAGVGVKADIRIGGLGLNSNVGGYSSTKNSGWASNIIMSTVYNSFYGAAIDTFNANAFKGVLMHELGHSLGFSHYGVNSSAGKSVMGFNSNGPQFDDLRALHRAHGDVYEKNNGNDSIVTATPLGDISVGTSLLIGQDIPDGGSFPTTLSTDTDIVSIDDDTDLDFYSFTVTESGLYTIKIAPRGPDVYEYNWNYTSSFGGTVYSKEYSDLSFTIYDSASNTAAAINNSPIGSIESTTLSLSPGTYYVAVGGDDTNANITEEFIYNDNDYSGSGWAQFYGVEIEVENGYNMWISSNGNATNFDFLADPDQDGHANGIEYILGGNPESRDNLLPTHSIETSSVQLAFDRNAASTNDTTQTLQFSEDLVEWTDLNLTDEISPEVTIGESINGAEPISIILDNPASSKLFWRLKVQQN